MNHYRQSIILFGFVLPLLACAIVVGGVAYLRSKVEKSFNTKSTHYATYQGNVQQARAIETNIGQKRSFTANWATALENETASEVTSNLREISDRLPQKEFQQTLSSRPNTASGFGAVSNQPSVPLELSFRATYRSMQRAFLELESRMPQLQLNDLRIDRAPASNSLNFQVTYTAWEQ